MRKVSVFLFLATIIALGLNQCKKSDNGNTDAGAPIVTTNEVSNITQTSATCGGIVTSNGDSNVTAKGICWSTSKNPTIDDNHTNDGAGADPFTSSITNLNAGTTYYVCAYATNSEGTGYGETRSFTTLENGGESITLSVSPSSLDFEATASSMTFAIQSNSSWTIECTESWCSVSPESGNGDATVSVSVVANESITERNAHITIFAGETAKEISVTQNGSEITLSISPDNLEFAPEASSKSVAIQCNTSWTVSSPASWCSVSPSSGNGNATLSVSVSANESSSYRTAVITVTAGNETRNISINQNGVSWVIIDGHRAVDLGLPSGTKWADCNVGANSPSEYGNFYSFTSTSSDWGGRWARPTEAQFTELSNLCEWTWTTVDGKNGFSVEGPNGNSIFLPAAGWSNGTNAGTRGYYWSKDKFNTLRYALYFTERNVFLNLIPAEDKCSVRLVAK